MSYVKRIVCFADSWKTGGSCVAGREFTSKAWGSWVRPISPRSSHEIWDSEKRYPDRSMPALLDVIDVPMQAHQPHGFQQENHVIDGSPWIRRATFIWSQIQGAEEHPAGPLWLNGFCSSRGTNDRVPETQAAGFTRSLYLVRPVNLRVVNVHNHYENRTEIRVRFELCNEEYCLKLTDPAATARLAPQASAEVTEVEDALMCVSLGEAFNGFAYKLAASIITP